MRRMILAAAALLAVSGAASAATVITFDGVMDFNAYEDFPPPTYVEDGVTIAGTPASWGAPGDVHLDDSGTLFSDRITVTTGGLFSALAVEIFGLGLASFLEVEATETTPSDLIPTAYDNVLLRGYVGGTLVAARDFSTGLEDSLTWLRFGPAFAAVDRFEILVTNLTGQPGVVCLDAPCGHITLDNLVIGTPYEVIPVPAAGWMLGGALALMLARRRRG